jgi:hypothetical protein
MTAFYLWERGIVRSVAYVHLVARIGENRNRRMVGAAKTAAPKFARKLRLEADQDIVNLRASLTTTVGSRLVTAKEPSAAKVPMAWRIRCI